VGQLLGIYRPDLGHGRRWVGTLSVAISTVSLVAGVAYGRPLSRILWVVLAVMPASFLLLLLTWALFAVLSRVSVYEHGITASGYRLPRASVAWSEIRGVDFLSMNGLSFVALKRDGRGSTVFIPASIFENDSFRRLVSSQLPPGNPLADPALIAA
jgi:hypothetical protein